MAAIQNVFLDDGGVMNDNRLRGPQWQRLVGEFFSPRLGGDPGLWAEANARILEPVMDRFFQRIEAWSEDGNYREICVDYDLDWLRSMCSVVGVDPPAGIDAQIDLVGEASDWIMPKVQASFPGARESILKLSGRFHLFTASQGPSWELARTLEGVGVRTSFERLYGPDLVNSPKANPRYYELIFADAGVDPQVCLVVDDSEEMLQHAQSAGAQVLLVTTRGPGRLGFPSVSALKELPEVIESISSK